MSAGGACVGLESGADFEPHQLVTLTFEIPRLPHAISVLGFVRWIYAGDGQQAGIQFATGLRAREVWAIHQLSLSEGPAKREFVPAPPTMRREAA